MDGMSTTPPQPSTIIDLTGLPDEVVRRAHELVAEARAVPGEPAVTPADDSPDWLKELRQEFQNALDEKWARGYGGEPETK